MKKTIIFGAGLIAEVAYYYLKNDSIYDVVAFTVDNDFINKKELFGLPIVSFDKVEQNYSPDAYNMLVAVGYQGLNEFRAKKYYEAKEKGYQLISYVSSKASNFGDIAIGDNCFILENQALQPCSKIGNNVTIWSGNHIGHHSIIKDHCFLTSQIVISGGAIIEPYCFIGVNATIGHQIMVGEKSIIGAASIITKNVEPKSVFIADNTPKFRLDSEHFMRFAKL